MNIVALAGGVGGAKLADGLQRVAGKSLTVIVNTADDFELHGLKISPDLDTVMYTLAGLADPERGWGIAGDTFTCLAMLKRLGSDGWFGLGDRDLGTHVLRTQWRRSGMTLQEVTAKLARALGVAATILPATNDKVSTIIGTDEGELPFQEYFVHRRWEPAVKSIRFSGIESAQPLPEAVEAIRQADLIVICPSNPFVSIEPILSLSDIRASIENGKCARVAVSPIVGGDALRGPAAKMSRELGIEPSATAVAERYKRVVDRFVMDRLDHDQADDIRKLGMQVLPTETVMKSSGDRERLAREIIEWTIATQSR